jgi:hypothetical protein
MHAWMHGAWMEHACMDGLGLNGRIDWRARGTLLVGKLRWLKKANSHLSVNQGCRRLDVTN